MDVIAILAIGGALLLGERLAAAVIAVMLATGEALERYAQGRAHRELTALLGRAPRDVQRYVDGRLETVPIDAVVVGDRVAIRPGEVVPVDGLAVGGAAVLDESALTGESRLVTRGEGEPVSSGTVNAGSSFDLRAIAPAAASTYAGIVRLVQEAQGSKAPFVRLADRYALLFIPLTLVISAAAWLVSGDPIRGLAVLVVATPCPLLLAAPIAIVAGISRAARRGVIVKGGGPARGTRPGQGHPVRQDRDAHRRPATSRGHRGRRRRPERRGIRAGSTGDSTRRRSCAWPHRSSSSRRTSWRARSSTRPASGASTSPCPTTSSRPPVPGSQAGSRGGSWPSARPSSAPATAGCRAGRATSGDAPRSRARRSPS